MLQYMYIGMNFPGNDNGTQIAVYSNKNSLIVQQCENNETIIVRRLSQI